MKLAERLAKLEAPDMSGWPILVHADDAEEMARTEERAKQCPEYRPVKIIFDDGMEATK